MLNVKELRKDFKNPEEEIAFLRSILEEQKKEEQTSGFQSYIGENKAETELRVGALLGKYKEVAPEKVLNKKYQMSENHVTTVAMGLEPEDHDEKLQKIIDILVADGLKNAFSVLSKLSDEHLEDDFHRFLVQYILKSDSRKKFGSMSETYQAVEATLFHIILPVEKGQDNSQQFAKQFLTQTISLMERFYSGMISIANPSDMDNNKNYFTVEVAKPVGSNQIKFFVSVPNNHKDLFKKQVLALFPLAKIEEQINDYNVFVPDGYTVGAYGQPGKLAALPIKTYKEFESDSLSVVLSVMSQMNTDEEGVAIQIVIKPMGEKYLKQYGKMLDKLKNKKRTLKQINAYQSIGGLLKYEAMKMFKTEKKIEAEQNSYENDDAQKYITEKLNATIFSTNLRLVASSKSAIRSTQILHEVTSSFKQYTEVKGNYVAFKEIKGREGNTFFKHFAYRYFDDNENYPLNSVELATIYHFPKNISERDFQELSQYDSVSAPAPMDLPKDGIYLGLNKYRHSETKIYMQKESRVRHMYVIGQTGTGKSKFLQNMIIQDIKNGEGLCFIDPHGQDLQEIMTHIPRERIDDVIYFDPGDLKRPMGLNMLEYDPAHPEQKTLIVNELLAIFNKLFDMKTAGGPAFEQYFRNSALLVMEHPESGCTLLEISKVLSDTEFRHMKLSHCKNPLVKQFFTNAEATSGEQGFENYVPYVTNKFDNFLSNEFMRPIISQEKSAFDIKDVMASKKILLINLSKGKLGELGSQLIGLIIVGKILVSAFARDPAEDPPPFYLFLDEFQNVATDSIKSILSEARKYKLGLTIAHQFIKQIPEDIKNAVFGNVGSKAIFRIEPEDAKFVESYFAPTFSAKDIIGQSVGNCYIQLLANNKPQKPFNLYTPLQPQGDNEVRDVIKELSALKYGKPFEEVNDMIMKKMGV